MRHTSNYQAKAYPNRDPGRFKHGCVAPAERDVSLNIVLNKVSDLANVKVVSVGSMSGS